MRGRRGRDAAAHPSASLRAERRGVGCRGAGREPRVGKGRVDQTQPLVFSADETTDIGDDYGVPVSADYGDSSRFNGRIDVVQIDVGTDDHSHLVDPAEIARVATARQ